MVTWTQPEEGITIIIAIIHSHCPLVVNYETTATHKPTDSNLQPFVVDEPFWVPVPLLTISYFTDKQVSEPQPNLINIYHAEVRLASLFLNDCSNHLFQGNMSKKKTQKTLSMLCHLITTLWPHVGHKLHFWTFFLSLYGLQMFKSDNNYLIIGHITRHLCSNDV